MRLLSASCMPGLLFNLLLETGLPLVLKTTLDPNLSNISLPQKHSSSESWDAHDVLRNKGDQMTSHDHCTWGLRPPSSCFPHPTAWLSLQSAGRWPQNDAHLELKATQPSPCLHGRAIFLLPTS
jgi:hypothetical protein